MVEYFAVGDSVVSVIFEVFGNAECTGQVFLCPCIIAEEPVCCRTSSGHKAGTRGAADGDLAVRAKKDDAFSAQFVYIGREHLLMAVAAKLWTQIIYGEEEDIGSLFVCGEQIRRQSHSSRSQTYRFQEVTSI